MLNRHRTVAWRRKAIFEDVLEVLEHPWVASGKDDRGLSGAGAIDIERPAAADIHRAADLRKILPVAGALRLLVKTP